VEVVRLLSDIVEVKGGYDRKTGFSESRPGENETRLVGPSLRYREQLMERGFSLRADATTTQDPTLLAQAGNVSVLFWLVAAVRYNYLAHFLEKRICQAQKEKEMFAATARTLCRKAGFPAVLACALAAVTGQGISHAGDRPLKAPVVLRVAQSGFAGVTGTEYRLEPNGAWQANQFVNDQATGAVGSGQLDAGEFITLSHQIAATDFARARSQASSYKDVNPTIIEIRYGDETVVAALPPGFSLGDACPDAARAGLCEVLSLARQIKSSMKD
jgi:hypothetical protein